jgi:hypothetical protein
MFVILPTGTSIVGDERLLSPEELAALFRRLDALIEEAKTLQEQITKRLLTTRQQDQIVKTGQPDRRRTTRKK